VGRGDGILILSRSLIELNHLTPLWPRRWSSVLPIHDDPPLGSCSRLAGFHCVALRLPVKETQPGRHGGKSSPEEGSAATRAFAEVPPGGQSLESLD
jgi:hypothetical protein